MIGVPFLEDSLPGPASQAFKFLDCRLHASTTLAHLKGNIRSELPAAIGALDGFASVFRLQLTIDLSW